MVTDLDKSMGWMVCMKMGGQLIRNCVAQHDLAFVNSTRTKVHQECLNNIFFLLPRVLSLNMTYQYPSEAFQLRRPSATEFRPPFHSSPERSMLLETPNFDFQENPILPASATHLSIVVCWSSDPEHTLLPFSRRLTMPQRRCSVTYPKSSIPYSA